MGDQLTGATTDSDQKSPFVAGVVRWPLVQSPFSGAARAVDDAVTMVDETVMRCLEIRRTLAAWFARPIRHRDVAATSVVAVRGHVFTVRGEVEPAVVGLGPNVSVSLPWRSSQTIWRPALAPFARPYARVPVSEMENVTSQERHRTRLAGYRKGFSGQFILFGQISRPVVCLLV